MNLKKVLVLMGGGSSEREVSLLSGENVVKNLDKQKYEAVPFILKENNENLWEIAKIKPDVVFIALHGTYGEDGSMQGSLELMGIPYTGSGVLASALGMNKIYFKKYIASENIQTAKCLTIKDYNADIPLKFPYVVKPVNGGSSVGVSIINGEADKRTAFESAFKYDEEAIVEEFIKGTEITCAVLGNDKPIALPIVEIIPKNEFFDYEAKYTEGKSEEIVPARLSGDLTEKVQEIAVKVHKLIGCRGFSRTDMIIKSDVPYVLEINTIPGLTPASLFPKAAAAAGISFPKLLDKIIQLALGK